MAMMSLIGKLFGVSAAASRDATKLDGTSEAALARSLSAIATGRAGIDHVCRGAQLVLDQGRAMRVRGSG